MSSELLGSAQNVLKGNLGGAWDITNGYQDAYTDLGIARRFGAAAAAYSLRDIGAMNGPVVRVRRNNDSTEEDFSANQVQAGVLEDFCDNVLTVGTAVNGTGSVDNYTFTANGNTGFDADNSAGGIGSAGFPYSFKNGDVMTVTYTVTNFSSTSGLSPQIRGTTGTSSVTQVAGGGTTFTANGTYTDTLTATADGTHLMFADGNTGSYTISNFEVLSHKTDGFVETWYDQSGSGNDATQTTAGQQPKIVENGSIVKNVKGFPSITFESANSTELDIGLLISNLNSVSAYVVQQKDTGDTLRLAGFTQGVSSDDSRFYLTFYSTNGSLPHFGYNDSATKISFGTTLTGTTNMYSAFAGDTNIEAFKNGTSVGTTALVDQAVTDTTSKIGQLSNSFYFDGKISEIFLTTQKLQDDAATINSDVTSYYNL